MKTALQVIGGVIEGIGLLITGVALSYTWSVNARDQKYWPAVRGQSKDVWDWIRRRPRTQRGNMVGVASGETVVGGTVSVSFPPQATVEQKIEHLQKELDQVNVLASEAKGAAARAEKAQKRDAAHLREQVADLRNKTEEQMRDNTIEGLPLAGLGLMLTALGLTLQVAGTALPDA